MKLILLMFKKLRGLQWKIKIVLENAPKFKSFKIVKSTKVILFANITWFWAGVERKIVIKKG